MQGVGPGAPDQPVVAVAAVEEVGAGLAGEGIVAGPALEQVVADLAADDVADGVAGEVVVVAGAVQVLDVDQRVVLGVAAGGHVGLQVDRDPGARPLVVGEIRTGAAVEVSPPAPPRSVSPPSPPLMVSTPSKPISRSAKVEPVMTSSPVKMAASIAISSPPPMMSPARVARGVLMPVMEKTSPDFM